MNPPDEDGNRDLYFSDIRRWPNAEHVVAYHSAILAMYGHQASVEQVGRVRAAILRPINQAASGGMAGDAFEAAARLTAALAIAHAFPDGNKRIAGFMALSLLELNGIFIEVDRIQLADHVLRIVETSQVGDEAALDSVVTEFAAFLRAG